MGLLGLRKLKKKLVPRSFRGHHGDKATEDGSTANKHEEEQNDDVLDQVSTCDMTDDTRYHEAGSSSVNAGHDVTVAVYLPEGRDDADAMDQSRSKSQGDRDGYETTDFDVYMDDSGQRIDPKELDELLKEQEQQQGIAPPPRQYTQSVAIVSDSSDSEPDSTQLAPPLPYMKPPLPIVSRSRSESSELSRQMLNTKSQNRRKDKSSGHKQANQLRRVASEGTNRYLHIFHEKLTTLYEESVHSDSGDDADDEENMSSSEDEGYPSLSMLNAKKYGSTRSNRKRGGSFDESNIKARWNYALQVMSRMSQCEPADVHDSVSEDVIVGGPIQDVEEAEI